MAISQVLSNRTTIKNVIIDFLALAFIYFVPAIAHLSGLPVYFIEPMRLMLILAIAHSSKANACFIALSLPFFSFMVSGHPEALKMLVITAELALNVWLFFYLSRETKNIFISTLSSIVLSKIFCYLMYLPLFSFTFVRSELDATFIIAQLISTLIFSTYLSFMFKKNTSF